MLLSEDDIVLGTIYGPPGSNAPLQRPTHAWADLGMTTAHLLEDGHGPDARRRQLPARCAPQLELTALGEVDVPPEISPRFAAPLQRL